MSRVHVNTQLLIWALERSGRNPDEISDRFPRLIQWIDGKALPTLRQLEAYARATYTPFGYFFLRKPPHIELSIPHYRTVTDDTVSEPSPNLIDSTQIVARRQDWIKEYLQSEGYDQLPFVGSASKETDYKKVAKQIRHLIGIHPSWASNVLTWQDALSHLKQLIEDQGIYVVSNGVVGNNTYRKLDKDEFRGFVMVDEYAPFIFLNNSDYKSAQIFTLAHELAHIWFGSSAAFDLRNLQPANERTEIICNKVAAEFLVPESELKQKWEKTKIKEDSIEIIARHFKVSQIVASRRLLDLEFITQREFFKFYKDWSQKEKSKPKSTGGNFYTTQPSRISKRFAHIVIRAVKENKLLYRDAYRLTGLYGKTFDSFTTSIGHSN